MRQARQGKAASRPGGYARVRRGSGIDWLVASTGAGTPSGYQGLSEGVAIPLCLVSSPARESCGLAMERAMDCQLGTRASSGPGRLDDSRYETGTHGGLESDAHQCAGHGSDWKYPDDATYVPNVVPVFDFVGDPWWTLDPVHTSSPRRCRFAAAWSPVLPVLCYCPPVLLGDTVVLPISRAVRDLCLSRCHGCRTSSRQTYPFVLFLLRCPFQCPMLQPVTIAETLKGGVLSHGMDVLIE
jgi:hypothetical protein